MNADELKRRTKKYGLEVLRLVDELPNSMTGRTIGQQLLRSALSVGANYRAACRGRSRAEFAAKAGIVIEEADETLYWMEVLVEAGIMKKERVASLLDEGNQIVAILVASVKTARHNMSR